MLGPWDRASGRLGRPGFVLNFIPFIGPFVATVLPALFAIVQFQSWEAATLIFAGVSLIQFLIGSYLEPRLSGSALSISPFLVVVAADGDQCQHTFAHERQIRIFRQTPRRDEVGLTVRRYPPPFARRQRPVEIPSDL